MLRTIEREITKVFKDYDVKMEAKLGVDETGIVTMATAKVFEAIVKSLEKERKQLHKKLKRKKNVLRKN